MDTLLTNYAIEFGKKDFKIELVLSVDEIERLRSSLSTEKNDPVGVSLNLKIANAILGCIL